MKPDIVKINNTDIFNFSERKLKMYLFLFFDKLDKHGNREKYDKVIMPFVVYKFFKFQCISYNFLSKIVNEKINISNEEIKNLSNMGVIERYDNEIFMKYWLRRQYKIVPRNFVREIVLTDCFQELNKKFEKFQENYKIKFRDRIKYIFGI